MDLEDLNEATESKVCFVPCLKWVRKGIAKENPEKVQLTKEELVQIIKDTQSKLKVTTNDDDEATTSTTATASGEMTVEEEFKLEDYDKDDEATALAQLGIQNVAELPESADDHFSDNDDDSEKEDDVIKPDDNLILVGKVDGDASILEVYIHNEAEGSLYCHHDIFLPAFPLCIEWLDHEPGHPAGNYCAIGSMLPTIDIWDLDIVNCLEPAYTLGRKGSKKKGVKAVGHKDAVLDLAWNSYYHHVLASGSVDQTVLLWDIDSGKPSTTIKSFNEKVQTLKWHKLEAYTLLAGSCDKTAKVFDCRNPDAFKSWEVSGETERVAWSPLQPYVFFASTSTGKVHCFDCRQGELWKIDAHEKEVTGLAVSEQCPGLLVTTSPDETMKVWDFNDGQWPTLVHEKELKMGVMHCLELCPDSPFMIAAGGDNKSKHFGVFDMLNFDPVKHHFGNRPLLKLEVEQQNDVQTNEIQMNE